jgi:acyl dehydratase
MDAITDDTPAAEPAFDRAWLGRPLDGGVVEVTAERILEFSRTVGETQPWFTDPAAAAEGPFGGLVAPSAFCNVCLMGPAPDIGLRGWRDRFQAARSFRALRPIRPGDRLATTIRTTEVYAKPGRSGRLTFQVYEADVRDANGATVAHIRHVQVYR